MEQALEIAIGQETTEKEVQYVCKDSGTSNTKEVFRMSPQKFKSKGAKPEASRKGLKCYRGGSSEHLANKCSHRETFCNKCQKVGHLERCCRFTKFNQPRKRVEKKKKSGRSDHLDCSDSSYNDDPEDFSDVLGHMLFG